MPRKEIDKIDLYAGKKLREYRIAFGITQSELGEKLDVSFQQIQKYEKGINRLKISQLAYLTELFKCPVSDLIFPKADSHKYTKNQLRILPLLEKLDKEQEKIIFGLIKTLAGEK